MNEPVLTGDSADRKAVPITSGVLDYFPNALAEVARLSKAGNDKHNPGQPLHWSRGKSADHADTIVRHLIDRGTVDLEDGIRHSVKVAWRALALLEEELIAAGATPGRNARSTTGIVDPNDPAIHASLNRDFGEPSRNHDGISPTVGGTHMEGPPPPKFQKVIG